MNEINWGIIGCGDVTEVKSGPAFNKVNHSSLVAVMRRDALKAEDYAIRHGVPKWYDDADLLINDPEVNAIYIATPPLQHEEYTIKALAAGKPVYVEKPMALNAAAAERMKVASEEYGVKLCIAHYRRAQPMFLKIKDLLREKAIGDVRFAQLQMLQPIASDVIATSETSWRLNPSISGGGLFHDLAPHQLDLMVYFFGEPKSFSGLSLNQRGTGNADDIVVGRALFSKGVVFNGTWCFTVSPSNKTDLFEIVGSKGKITFQVFGNKVTLATEGSLKEFVFDPIAHVEQPMIEKVTNYFLGGDENPCSAKDAILSMKMMDSFTI
ncbi:Gfo/Idh/MocA family oxidoreductase [Pedobacter frigoris]|uniref:Gfo/Idh/MocA family protein n=1 Tax=Pedobacter frigoris TaxID=2571272 RepID=UPI00292DA32A|nr:Gfo/Idh/MocA family oxidoreductase [Pedobacter frigoris]